MRDERWNRVLGFLSGFQFHQKRQIRVPAVFFAATLILSACAVSTKQDQVSELSKKLSVPNEKQLIVYTSHKEEVYLPIIREFEKQTGIWVEIHAGGTAQMMQLAEEASRTGDCDIMFGGGIESYEAHKDIFQPFVTRENASLDEAYLSPEGYYTEFSELPIVFIYNNKLVAESEAPRKWEDLFSESWTGNIAFADPGSSGTSYTILSTMQQLFGEEKESLIVRFYDQLDGKVLSSSGQIIPKVSDGTYLIGITLEETAKKYIDQDYSISMIYPEDGTSSVPDGCAMVKNAPHSYNAGVFIDFMVSYDTQRYIMENFYRRPVRTDIELTESYGQVSILPFDIPLSASQEAEALDIWTELTRKEED